MSFQVNAALETAQAILLSNFQDAEKRAKANPTFMGLLEVSDFFTPDYNGLRTREDRQIDVKFLNRAIRSTITERTFNHTGTVGTAGTFTPTWATVGDVFTKTLKQGDNNVFSNADMLATEFTDAFLNINDTNETDATNFIFAGRSGVNIATQEGTFNVTDDVFVISLATAQERFMQIIQTTMEVNKYRGQLDVYCDTVAWNLFNTQSAQGSANSTNLSYQFTDGNKRFIHSIEMGALGAALAGNYTDGFCVVVPRGTASSLPWIPIQNRDGIITTEGIYSTMINPFDGLPYALHTYIERVDGTGTGGFQQDVKTEYEVSIDLSFDQAPLSVAGETTFQAFALQ